MKQLKPYMKKKDGTVVFNLDCDETNFDWIRSARMSKHMSEEDVERRIEEMDKNPTYAMTKKELKEIEKELK